MLYLCLKAPSIALREIFTVHITFIFLTHFSFGTRFHFPLYLIQAPDIFVAPQLFHVDFNLNFYHRLTRGIKFNSH